MDANFFKPDFIFEKIFLMGQNFEVVPEITPAFYDEFLTIKINQNLG